MTEDSIIQLFKISEKGHQLIPTRHCYAINWLKVIMDKFPDNYIDVYKYLFYMTCPDPINNPYFNVKDVVREEMILRDNKMTFSTEEDCVVEALEKCKLLYETPVLRAHQGLKIMIDNVSDYMSTAKVVSGRDGNFSALLSAGKSLRELRETYNQLTADMHSEQKVNAKRGGGELSYDFSDENTRADD